MNVGSDVYILCLIPCGIIGIIAVFFYLLHGSWFSPGGAWSAFWFGGTLLPLLLAPEFLVTPRAVWIIAAFTFTVGISSQLGLEFVRNKYPNIQLKGMVPNDVDALPFQRSLIFISSISALWAAQIMVGGIGVSLIDVFDFSVLVKTAGLLSDRRYQGMEEPMMVRLLMMAVYLGSLLGGRFYAQKRSIRVLPFTCLPLFGSLLYSVLTTAKAGFLFSLIFWLAAWFAESVRCGRPPFKVTIRLALCAVCGVVALMAIFVVAMRLRYGADDVQDTSFVHTRIKEYLIAHLSVFSSWLDHTDEHGLQLQWGAAEYFGIADHFGLTVRKQGAFAFVQQYGYFADSNVYSIYRGLIEDFSLPGALVYVSIISLAVGMAYQWARSRRGGIASVILAAFYATLLSSHVLNPFGYTSLFVAFLLYGSLITIHAIKYF